jgi:hypothetical protein
MVDESEWSKADKREMLRTGIEFLKWAREFESNCREQIANDLHKVYSEAWADADSQEGSPPCTRDEFIASLRLSAIDLHEAGTSIWLYDCGGLFCGHAVSLMIDTDRSFIGKASLFG